MNFRKKRRSTLLTSALLTLGLSSSIPAGAVSEDVHDDIQLELSPRICTLNANDAQCDTVVHAVWRSARNESLCLVIVGRADVKRCWDKYSEGSYSMELVFSTDQVFQLQNIDPQQVLATEVLRVIREAIRYRHKRRDPWNVFG